MKDSVEIKKHVLACMPNDDSTPKPWKEVEGNDRARGGTPIGQWCPIQCIT